jgi:IS5 family transposase
LVLAFLVAVDHTGWVQGKSDPNRELLDAAALCRQLVPAGGVEAFLADHRDRLFPDELFADLFPSGRGRPSVPAEVIATAMVLQALEGLSDRDAARAVVDRISWKVACGLPLDDEGFDFTVLTYWRSRLRKSKRPERIFDAVREVIDATGVLKGRTRRALDSTLLDDAVATQDTVTQLIAAIRRVRRLIPAAAAVTLYAHDYDSVAKPQISWDDAEAKQALVTGLVNDALAVIGALADVELTGEQADAVGLLALIAGQDVEPGDTPGSWRIAQRVAPDRVISVVDPDARHARKSRSDRHDGYKAHLAAEPETGLITDCAVTPANSPDGPTGVSLVADEPEPVEVLADSAYGSGKTRADLAAMGHTATIKPIPLRAAVPGGFTRDDFTVDHETNTVTCPAGLTATITKKLSATFGARCRGCPLRERCTTSAAGKTVGLNLYDPELVAARAQARTVEHQDTYRQWRPMIERNIAWLVAKGNRRLRYRGTERNHQWLTVRAAALNLRRLVNLGLNHDDTWTVAMT